MMSIEEIDVETLCDPIPIEPPVEEVPVGELHDWHPGGPPFRCLKCAKIIPQLDDENKNDRSCGPLFTSNSVPSVS